MGAMGVMGAMTPSSKVMGGHTVWFVPSLSKELCCNV